VKLKKKKEKGRIKTQVKQIKGIGKRGEKGKKGTGRAYLGRNKLVKLGDLSTPKTVLQKRGKGIGRRAWVT